MYNRNKIYGLLSIGLMVFVQNTRAQNNGYTRDEIIKIQGIFSDDQIYGLNVNQKQTTINYYDGFGRAIQTVALQASPLKNDLIQPVAYDNLGRQTTSYLPYAGQSTDVSGSYRQTAISTDQPAFYNNNSQYLVPVDGAPYNQQVFEKSPMQRLLQAGMVGNGYQPASGQHYKTVSYRSNSNTIDGNILIWSLTGTFTSNYYGDNMLSVNDFKDEGTTETLTFTDFFGHVILKRQILNGNNLDTYYIYNAAGMISYVVPPLATSKLAPNYNLAASPISNLVFKFLYDTRGRLIEKTVPSKGKISIVYDPMNRPVLLQDANNLAANEWIYMKYDSKGRIISQGVYTDATTTPTSHIGRPNMQVYVNSLNYSTWYETRTATVTNFGYYTSNVFPTTSTFGTITPLSYAYYDDYYMTMGSSPDFSYVRQNDTNLPNEEIATSAQLKGMPTITTETTIGAGLTNTWLTTATFYDKNLHVIQVRSNNHVYYTGYATSVDLTDTKTIVNDFPGVPQASKVLKRSRSTASTIVYTALSYDHVYRVTGISQKYNTGSFNPVAAYSYNEIGQVIQKNIGFVSVGTWLQNLDLRYNIRGQLLNINNSKLMSDVGITNSDGNDVFGMQFLYDQIDHNLNNTPNYTGKISAVKWMSKDAAGNNSYERSYTYSYDDLGRFTNAAYAERLSTAGTSDSFNVNTGGWNETVTGYDLNGNITHLNRNASTPGATAGTLIDNLTYTYSTTNPNWLNTVTDATGIIYGFGLQSGGNVNGNYTYDVNGNLTNDPYKNIGLGYNFLNRTDKITMNAVAGRYINYTYSASGSLLRKQQYDNVAGVSTLITTTDYVGEFQYITNGTGSAALSYFSIPEGRVLNNAGTLNQEFIITDQQRNARVSFNNTGTGGTAKVVQEDSYYPFGLIMPGGVVTGGSNKRLYNGGAEWQNDYGNLPDYYQTFYRNYDAALGRFVAVDPEAESAESMTSFQYADDNPVMSNDPQGNFTLGREKIDIFSIGNNSEYANDYGSDNDVNGTGNGGGINYGHAYWNQSDAQLIAEAKQGDVLALNEYARRHGTKYTWNPWGGAEISEAEWVANGGNPDKIKSPYTIFVSGDWKATANQGGPGDGNTNGNTVTGIDPDFKPFPTVDGKAKNGSALWDPHSIRLIGGVEVNIGYNLTLDDDGKIKVTVTSLTAFSTGLFGSFTSFDLVNPNGFSVAGDIVHFDVFGNGVYMGFKDPNKTELQGYYNTKTGYFSITGTYHFHF